MVKSLNGLQRPPAIDVFNRHLEKGEKKSGVSGQKFVDKVLNWGQLCMQGTPVQVLTGNAAWI